MTAPVRIGVVGYGVGGKYLHTPFIESAEGVELAGVVTRSASRRAHLAKDWPGVPVIDSLAALLASGVDAVTITTPPQTRSALVLEAVAAAVHVVVDKPFAPTAVEARRLVRAADDAGVILNVFHNRRWDADIRTLAAVVADGRLGDVWRVHTRMDQDAPDLLEAGVPRGAAARPGQSCGRPDDLAVGARPGGHGPPRLGRPRSGSDGRGFDGRSAARKPSPVLRGVVQAEPRRPAYDPGIRRPRLLPGVQQRCPGPGAVRR